MPFQWMNVSQHSLNKASYKTRRAGIQEIPMDSWPQLRIRLEIPDPLTHSLMGLDQRAVPVDWRFG